MAKTFEVKIHTVDLLDELTVLPTDKSLYLQEYDAHHREQVLRDLKESAAIAEASAKKALEANPEDADAKRDLEDAAAKLEGAKGAEEILEEHRKWIAERRASRDELIPQCTEMTFTLLRVDYDSHLAAIDKKKTIRGDRIVVDAATSVVDELLLTHVVSVREKAPDGTVTEREMKPADVKALDTKVAQELSRVLEHNISVDEGRLPFCLWLSKTILRQNLDSPH